MKPPEGNCPNCDRPWTEENRRVHYKTEPYCEACHPRGAKAGWD